MTDMFWSQFGEDRILSKLFPGRGNGTCVEVGANDGINDSNTYHFEQMGWKCVLVEPNHELCEQIRKTRGCVLHECAASDRHGEATLYLAEGSERSHGVSMLADEPHDAARKLASYGFSPVPIQVPTKTLDEILEQSGVDPGFEFLTIDVEGHEIDVLRGFDLTRWKPSVLIIEDNSEFTDHLVRDHLRARDYIPFMRTGVNDWYAPRGSRFSGLPNRFGYFLKYLVARTKSTSGYLALRGLYRQLKR